MLNRGGTTPFGIIFTIFRGRCCGALRQKAKSLPALEELAIDETAPEAEFVALKSEEPVVCAAAVCAAEERDKTVKRQITAREVRTMWRIKNSP